MAVPENGCRRVRGRAGIADRGAGAEGGAAVGPALVASASPVVGCCGCPACPASVPRASHGRSTGWGRRADVGVCRAARRLRARIDGLTVPVQESAEAFRRDRRWRGSVCAHVPRARRLAATARVRGGLCGGGRLLGPAGPCPRRQRWSGTRCRVRAGPVAGHRAAAHAVAARLGGRVAARRGVLQRREAEPRRQHEVRLEEPHLAARRHRRRPRTPRRRRHRRSLLPRPRRRPREARHHRRGPADHAVGPSRPPATGTTAAGWRAGTGSATC